MVLVLGSAHTKYTLPVSKLGTHLELYYFAFTYMFARACFGLHAYFKSMFEL